MTDLIYRLRYPAMSWTQDGGSHLDVEETVSDMAEAADKIERLQHIIDSRPAINAALPESYIKWSQEIYLLDFVQATGAHS